MSNIPRSLRASSKGQEKAELAFFRTGLTQKAFARKLEIARSTFANFLAGQPVDRPNFYKICEELKLDPEAIFEPTNDLLRQARTTCEQPFSEPAIIIDNVVQLHQWLQNFYEEGWQAVESILGSKINQAAFRSSVTQESTERAKLIDLGMDLNGQTFALLVGINPEDNSRLGINVQLHPEKETYLPPNIKLGLLAESGELLQEVASRSLDFSIQLRRFKVLPGNKFSIKVELDELSITEAFTT